jgi:general secretion pathway protein D
VKTTFPLLFLLLTGLGLQAQTPPAPIAAETNLDVILRDALRRAIAGETNAPTAKVPAPPAAVPAAVVATPARGAVAPVEPPKVATPAPAPAPVAPAAEEEVIPRGSIDFTSATLDQVLTIYAELVGRTILRPANLNAANIVLKTQTPLTKKEAIQALDAVLSLSGIAMINVGDKFVKAVPLGEAGSAGAAFDKQDASQLPELGQYVTHILQVTNSKPSELVPILLPFAKLPNALIPIDSSGILVLRDNAENVKRVLEMIKELDVSVPAEFVSEVIPIKYALASEIQSALSSLTGGGGSASATVGRSTARTTGAPAAAARPGTTSTGTTGQPGQAQPPITTPAGTPSSTSSFSDRLRNIINKASNTATGEMQILGQTKIIADERTNSLLIFATRQDMEIIKKIISQLDVVLAQVLIETIIMDVTIDNTWNLGVSAAQEPNNFSANSAGGGANNSGQNFLSLLGNSGTNVTSSFFGSFTTNLNGVLGSGLSYWGNLGSGPTFDLALQAAASDSRVNVIQKPRIQTSHATPASLFIGSTVPYVSSTYYGGGYAGGPSSSYQQLKVGISLNVTPFINPDGLVVMKIDEAIDEISGSVAVTGVGNVPTTTSRTLSAEVAVRDRDTIILGGFIRNSENLSTAGVPLLKDIPILGGLFSSKSSAKERDELIVLMRPTVLKTPELAAMQVVEEKKRLPGVLHAEREMGAEERKEVEAELRRTTNGTAPIAP